MKPLKRIIRLSWQIENQLGKFKEMSETDRITIESELNGLLRSVRTVYENSKKD